LSKLLLSKPLLSRPLLSMLSRPLLMLRHLLLLMLLRRPLGRLPKKSDRRRRKRPLQRALGRKQWPPSRTRRPLRALQLRAPRLKALRRSLTFPERQFLA
jgi:hypothetical protein